MWNLGNRKSFLLAPRRRPNRVKRIPLTASSPREMNAFFPFKKDLGIEELLKSESASGGLRKPRTPRRPMYRLGVHLHHLQDLQFLAAKIHDEARRKSGAAL